MIDLIPEKKSDCNIISLTDGGKPLDILLKERGPTHCQCRWHAVEYSKVVVDEELRQVVCEDCQRVIDPFDYLLKWAQAGHRRMTGLKDLDIEIRKKQVSVLELKTAITRERAKLRKDNPRAPELEPYTGAWYKQKTVNLSDWEVQI